MEFDKDGSPFIPFPAPHEDLRLSVSIYTDGEVMQKILNDPRVYTNLLGPPFPYTQKSWDEWWLISSKVSDDSITELQEIQQGKRKWVGAGSPITVIRKMNSDGTGVFIGNIGIRRREFFSIQNEVERKRAKDENDALEAGDPRIVWEIGYFLSPEEHGRGIMPVALRLLMEKYLIPSLNAHRVIGVFFDYNTASKRVFEKNGFEFMGVTPNAIELSEAKTGVKGKKVGLGTMIWERKLEP